MLSLRPLRAVSVQGQWVCVGGGDLPLLKLGFKLSEHLDDALVRRQARDDAVHLLSYLGGISRHAGRDILDGKVGKEVREDHPRLEKDPDGVEIRHQPSSGVVQVPPAGLAWLPLPVTEVLLADELLDRSTIAALESIQELLCFEDDFDGVSCQATWASKRTYIWQYPPWPFPCHPQTRRSGAAVPTFANWLLLLELTSC